MRTYSHTKFYCFIIGTIIFFPAVYTQSSFAQTAQQIINKHIQAIGGQLKINSINTYSFEEGSSVVYYKKPGKWRMDYMESGKITQTQIYHGENGWTLFNAERAEPASSGMSLEYYLPGFLSYVTSTNYKIEATGKDNASDNLLLKITPLVNNILNTTYTYYINPSTWLITKMRESNDGISYTIYFEDYNVINGLKMPMKIIHENDDTKGKRSEVITKVQFNIVLDDKLFLKPALLKKGLYGYKDATGKWGYRDENFITVIKPKYDATWEFEEGLGKVILNNLYGFINVTGKEVVPLKYTSLSFFQEGLVAAELNKKFGFLDPSGKEVTTFQYTNAGDFKEGFATVEINSKWGCIDKTGKLVIPAIYDRIQTFDNGMACVKVGKKYGFINKKGIEVIPLVYDYIGSFKNDKFPVKKDGESFFIDKTGTRIN